MLNRYYHAEYSLHQMIEHRRLVGRFMPHPIVLDEAAGELVV
jgi:hypothetical protein